MVLVLIFRLKDKTDEEKDKTKEKIRFSEAVKSTFKDTYSYIAYHSFQWFDFRFGRISDMDSDISI